MSPHPGGAGRSDGRKDSDALVEVSGLSVHFPITEGAVRRKQVGAVRAVDGIDMVLHRGETVGLVGESGSGKSTTGRAILQLVKSTAGSVRFDGQDLGALGREPMRKMRRRMQIDLPGPVRVAEPTHEGVRDRRRAPRYPPHRPRAGPEGPCAPGPGQGGPGARVRRALSA